MARRPKKKRNKRYTGEYAAVTKKTVTRVSAPERSKIGEWWHENRKDIAARGVLLGIGLILVGIVWLVASFIF